MHQISHSWYPNNQLTEKTQFVHATATKYKHPLQEPTKNTKYVLAI